MDGTDNENAGTALYAPHQTSLYVAPPVVRGRIPKNLYGNLDVYVPSMVPPGGIHIRHPETARAARIIGIDHADAVTGFLFKGRHGTAIMSGAVVAAEYREAVEEIIKAFENEQAQAEEEQRSLVALKMWKKFLAGLRIRERIDSYDIEGERDTAMKYGMEKADADAEIEDEGGGFLPDRDAVEPIQPTAKPMPTRTLPALADDDEGGGFCAGEDEQEEMDPPHAIDGFVNRVDDGRDDGGGFQLDHDDQNAGHAVRGMSEDDYEDPSHEDEEEFTNHIPEETGGEETLDKGAGFLPEDGNGGHEHLSANGSAKPSDLIRGTLDSRNTIDTYDYTQHKNKSEEAVSDLSAGELGEATMLQQLYETQASGHLAVCKRDVTTPVSSEAPEPLPTQGTTAGGERGSSAHLKGAYPTNEPVIEARSESDTSEEDKGSLLSHDPDDEDADPDWLT